MRRVLIAIPLLVALLVGLGVAGRGGLSALAQEATPAVDGPRPGVSFTPLGFGTADQLPTVPADFALFRLGLEPGSSFPVEASDASVALVVIESGTLTIRVEAPVHVTRAATIAAFATPGVDENSAPTPEAIPAGTEFTMAAGDSAFFPANVAGEVRNAGQEPAVALVATLEPHGVPAGTPAATPIS